MSYWKDPEDQTKPCLCGCGQEVSGYYTDAEGIGWKSAGLSGGYADDSCVSEARDKALMQESDGEGLPTFRDVISGTEKSSFSQVGYRIDSLKRAQAKANMIGDKHQAAEAAKKISEIQGDSL